MSQPQIITRKQGRAGRITLNRPEALHAMTQKMCEQMADALLGWAKDPDIEFILVDHAAETRGFCAGGDIRMLRESGQTDGLEGAGFFRAEYQLNTLIHEYPKPYIALIDGVCMGGGVGISIHGSHRIATERTLFAMPESGIGLFPDIGGGYFLPRLKGKLGLWLALTGARLKGEDALAAGIATHFAPSDELPALTKRLCAEGLSVLDPLQNEAEITFAAHLDEMDQAFEAASVEDILERLSTGSDWAKAQAERLAQNSPLTVKIAFEQLKRGATMPLREVMKMEYRLARRIIMTENFHEGVRAVLIDRDNHPSWTPARLADVSVEQVESFFAPLETGELDFLDL